jgi:hypothetical protein
MPRVDQPMDMPYGVQCAAVSAISVLFRLQIRFEKRFEHENCRRFRRPIPDSGTGMSALSAAHP